AYEPCFKRYRGGVLAPWKRRHLHIAAHSYPKTNLEVANTTTTQLQFPFISVYFESLPSGMREEQDKTIRPENTSGVWNGVYSHLSSSPLEPGKMRSALTEAVGGCISLPS